MLAAQEHALIELNEHAISDVENFRLDYHNSQPVNILQLQAVGAGEYLDLTGERLLQTRYGGASQEMVLPPASYMVILAPSFSVIVIVSVGRLLRS